MESTFSVRVNTTFQDDVPSHGAPSLASRRDMQPGWYSGATRGQWLALTAALLGWAFDGFEQGVFPLVARPALIELEGLSEQARILKESKKDSEAWRAAQAAVDTPVREWNAIL